MSKMTELEFSDMARGKRWDRAWTDDELDDHDEREGVKCTVEGCGQFAVYCHKAGFKAHIGPYCYEPGPDGSPHGHFKHIVNERGLQPTEEVKKVKGLDKMRRDHIAFQEKEIDYLQAEVKRLKAQLEACKTKEKS